METAGKIATLALLLLLPGSGALAAAAEIMSSDVRSPGDVEVDETWRNHRPSIGDWEWTEVNPDAPWARRAGLQVVNLKGRFYLMGGRTSRPPSVPPIPGDSDIWGDVWVSEDRGETWDQLLATNDESHWAARAYFRAERKGAALFLFGGQNFKVEPNDCPPVVPDCPPFVAASDFFNDVWKSRDGEHWVRLTDDAGWEPRAGLSSVVFRGALWVMGGSQNDDDAIGGPTGPARKYYNDVWKSYNGRDWIQVTAAADWEPRAGAVTVAKNGYIYLLGGEDGFTCEPLPNCEPPYFNDVWRTRDGEHWEQVTGAAEWAPRAGHQVAVVGGRLVLLGGFGLLANPQDVWVSRGGARWTQVSDAPWNVAEPSDVKYDFAIEEAWEWRRFPRRVIYTFGGDRETFDFTDPTNYLQLDNDVWRFAPPSDD